MHQQRPGVSECPESYARWYCLNGATCFAVEIRNTTLYNCWCPIGFQGLRCDYKYPEHRNDADSEVSTSIELVGQEIDNQASSNQLIVAGKFGLGNIILGQSPRANSRLSIKTHKIH